MRRGTLISSDGSAGLPASGEIAMVLNQIRNPNIEIRNKRRPQIKVSKFKIPKRNPKKSVLNFSYFWSFEFVSNFGFWYSKLFCLLFHSTGHRFTFQMSAAYSPIVRSLENFPEPATFKIALRDHPTESA